MLEPSTLADKWRLEGAPVIPLGVLDDVNRSLDSWIGKLDPKVLKAVMMDHVAKPDSKVSFVAESTTTTSEFEFKFVMEPPEGGSRPSMSPVSLKEAMLKVNEALHEHGAMPMSWPEAVAARLCTGPMGAKYDAVLRGCLSSAPTQQSEMIQLCCAAEVAEQFTAGALAFEQAAQQANRYTTTLHALNSCLLKLVRLSTATSIYRASTASFRRPR